MTAPRKKRRGRPHKAAPDKRTKAVSLRLTESELAAIDRACGYNGASGRRGVRMEYIRAKLGLA